MQCMFPPLSTMFFRRSFRRSMSQSFGVCNQALSTLLAQLRPGCSDRWIDAAWTPARLRRHICPKPIGGRLAPHPELRGHSRCQEANQAKRAIDISGAKHKATHTHMQGQNRWGRYGMTKSTEKNTLVLKRLGLNKCSYRYVIVARIFFSEPTGARIGAQQQHPGRRTAKA